MFPVYNYHICFDMLLLKPELKEIVHSILTYFYSEFYFSLLLKMVHVSLRCSSF